MTDRIHASIDLRHCNINAALDRLGMPTIAGYRPRPNFQRDNMRTRRVLLDCDRGVKRGFSRLQNLRTKDNPAMLELF